MSAHSIVSAAMTVVLAVLLPAGLAGCSGDKPADSASPASTPTAGPHAAPASTPVAKEGPMDTVQPGDTVFVEYTGKLEDGSVFDATSKHGGEPLTFTVGARQMIPGFDKGVVGMKLGESKTLTLPPEEAYGQRHEQMIVKMPRQGGDDQVKVGQQVMVGTSSGQRMSARVVKVEADGVTIDANHELAGKTLIFEVKLVKLEKKAG